MINEINFWEQKGFFEDYNLNDQPLKNLTSLSKINLFVGANNSGKSRFLRKIITLLSNYQSPDLYSNVPSTGRIAKPICTLLNLVANDLNDVIRPLVQQIGDFLQSNPPWTAPSPFSGDAVNEYDIQRYVIDVRGILGHKRMTSNQISQESAESVKKLVQEIVDHLENQLPLFSNNKFQATYFPILRSLRKYLIPEGKDVKIDDYRISFEDYKRIDHPILKQRTLLDHFFKEDPQRDSHYESKKNLPFVRMINPDVIFSGEDLYERLYELLNSREDQRSIKTEFQQFLGEYFFNNANVELSAIEHNHIRDVFVKIGKEKEFPIQDLGDGIQSIILLTFPLFYYKNENAHIVFYEEPELYMHPGMQRIFIDVLRSFENVQAFIVTHSNHILDTSLDYKKEISIYSFEKEIKGNKPVFNIQNLSSPGLSLLNMLGVRNSSVFLSNCCLWVEGISDRIYIRRYLELYNEYNRTNNIANKSFYEDLHFSFLEYGGNQIVHYDFSDVDQTNHIKAKKITNRILLIQDQDKGKESRHQLLVSQLGDNYYVLNVLEIENLLTPNIIRKVLKDYQKDITQKIIVAEFEHKSYATKPIGKLLNTLVGKKNYNKICTAGTKTVTPKIINKAEFALRTVNHLNSFNDLSEEAKILTKKVYAFIKQHNPC